MSTHSSEHVPAHVLPIIVLAQFAGTSLWFAGNAVAADLEQAYGLSGRAIDDLISAVQFGFISGTLVFAVLSIADRFSPARVFLFSAVAGALFNLGVYWPAGDVWSILIFRYFTGFFLAGIYPVGMKIAADWYRQGLGRALGYLVGALVVGKAFPHLLRAFTSELPWTVVLFVTSALAVSGGLLLYVTVGDGPYRRPAVRFRWNAVAQVFRFPDFRSAAFGYFGHMWELYAFWAFVPVILATHNRIHQADLPVSLWAGTIIAAGGLGCVIGGYLSLRRGSARVAATMLLTSGVCCLLSPALVVLPAPFMLLFLLVWGFTVVGDSPQFSTLVARHAPTDYVGTALTIVNCIGFAITIFSIQALGSLLEHWPPAWLYLILLPGPLFGLYHIRRLVNQK